MKSIRSHMDPEIEEQLKWIKIGKTYNSEQPQTLTYHKQNQRLWDYSIASPKTMQFKVQGLPVPYYSQSGFLWHTEWQRGHSKLLILYAVLCIIGNWDSNRPCNFVT